MLHTEKEKIACLKSYWTRNNIIKAFVKPLRKAEAFLILRVIHLFMWSVKKTPTTACFFLVFAGLSKKKAAVVEC
jgi:hypothetical protein